MKKKNLRAVGDHGEQMALTFLLGKSYVLVTSNYRCKQGELDLVMRDGDSLVFIEVKYRKSLSFGSPLEAITLKKQAKLLDIARYYLYTQPYDGPIRFDVVGIIDQKDRTQIEHIQNVIVS